MRDDFCVFILTHGRPDRVHTYDLLMKSGYTGKTYIVIDNEDTTEAGYRERFGDKVLQFDKTEWAEKTDEGDNFQHRKAIVYARNACWELARQVGCRYFVQFDDDYTSFAFRYKADRTYTFIPIHQQIDAVFQELLTFAELTPTTAIAMSQGGDWIGGGGIGVRSGQRLVGRTTAFRRKCMNSWFCNIDKPIIFFGHMNEDVSAYVTHGRRGQLFFTTMQVMLAQKQTQRTAGGMSDLYLSSGTYVKSFYTVMAAPSCTRIGLMGDPRSSRMKRIHHDINWHNTAPKLLREEHKKVL